MQTLTEGYRSLSVLVELHGDKLLYAATVAVALALSAGLGSLWAPESPPGW